MGATLQYFLVDFTGGVTNKRSSGGQEWQAGEAGNLNFDELVYSNTRYGSAPSLLAGGELREVGWWVRGFAQDLVGGKLAHLSGWHCLQDAGNTRVLRFLAGSREATADIDRVPCVERQLPRSGNVLIPMEKCPEICAIRGHDT